MDLKVSMEASAVAAVADGACTENEQSVHIAATRLRVSGAIGTMPIEAVSNLLQAAKVGGRGREQAAPATKEQKLKNARLNAATSRCMPLEHHRHSSTRSTDEHELRLLSGSCAVERILAKLQAVAPRSSNIPDEPPVAAFQTSELDARAASDRAAATCTGSSRPKYKAEKMRNTAAWRSLAVSGETAADNARSCGTTSSAKHAFFIRGRSALASG